MEEWKFSKVSIVMTQPGLMACIITIIISRGTETQPYVYGAFEPKQCRKNADPAFIVHSE